MARFLLFFLALFSFPWGVRTWWQMRKAGGPKERAFISRTSLSAWLLLASSAVVVGALKGRPLLFVLPVLVVLGLGIRYSWRKARARIQEEERDPLSRAKRVN